MTEDAVVVVAGTGGAAIIQEEDMDMRLQSG